MDKNKFVDREKEIKYTLPWLIEHEALLVLVPKDDAGNSYDARKLVLLGLEGVSGKVALQEYSVGGIFSGLLSDICKEEVVVPYYNKEMREVIRKGIDKLADFIRKELEKIKEVPILASEIKKANPEFKKYNEAEILDALRLELKDLDIDMSYIVVPSPRAHGHDVAKIGDLVYIFMPLRPLTADVTKGFWAKTHRYMSVELGYEDDAMIVNECLYREIIDKNEEKIVDIYRGLVDITPEIIGKKWVVLVDIY